MENGKWKKGTKKRKDDLYWKSSKTCVSFGSFMFMFFCCFFVLGKLLYECYYTTIILFLFFWGSRTIKVYSAKVEDNISFLIGRSRITNTNEREKKTVHTAVVVKWWLRVKQCLLYPPWPFRSISSELIFDLQMVTSTCLYNVVEILNHSQMCSLAH